MEILIKVAQLVLSLSILVILHEFGHFTFAKLFKTRVEKFYLFFDPWFSLFKFKKGETEYGVGWLPLGGYVKISGMIDESMDTEQMKQPPQPYEFRSKPIGQRLMIMLAGVLVNFILALVIYASVLYVWGEEYLPTANAKYGIMCDSIATNMGLKNGDKIVSVDYKKVENFSKIVPTMLLDNAKTIQVQRGSQIINIRVPEAFISQVVKSKSTVVISPRFPFIVGDFVKNSPAKQAGFIKGDKVVQINKDSVQFFDQFKTVLSKNKGKSIAVKVIRGGKEVNLSVVVPASGLLGIYPKGEMGDFFQLKKIEYGFFASVPAGIKKGIYTTGSYLKQMKLLFQPKTKVYESLGGFISIGKIFPGVWDWESFWSLTAFLSIILAIMNILPIPGLDGGHVMFLIFEMVTGRKPGDKFLEYAEIVGMILLFGLLIYANANDVIKLFK
ncbi:MAG: RIP metalloprotease RseP [Bacteroidota bacterium]|nr:RIP metalloprotease RseP [Bacteroidota bacterium]